MFESKSKRIHSQFAPNVFFLLKNVQNKETNHIWHVELNCPPNASDPPQKDPDSPTLALLHPHSQFLSMVRILSTCCSNGCTPVDKNGNFRRKQSFETQ